jgi:hypothetical protein
MALHPPDDEAWAWEVLESVQVGMGREIWTVLLAVAAQPEGWYVRLSRVLEAEGLIRDLILDGAGPDRARPGPNTGLGARSRHRGPPLASSRGSAGSSARRRSLGGGAGCLASKHLHTRLGHARAE